MNLHPYIGDNAEMSVVRRSKHKSKTSRHTIANSHSKLSFVQIQNDEKAVSSALESKFIELRFEIMDKMHREFDLLTNNNKILERVRDVEKRVKKNQA